jgi:hypothetical protein
VKSCNNTILTPYSIPTHKAETRGVRDKHLLGPPV